MEHIGEPSLTEVYNEVLKAQEELRLAKDDETAARSRATNAMNNANKAQHKFDTILDKIKKNAPSDTDWKRHLER